MPSGLMPLRPLGVPPASPPKVRKQMGTIFILRSRALEILKPPMGNLNECATEGQPYLWRVRIRSNNNCLILALIHACKAAISQAFVSEGMAAANAVPHNYGAAMHSGGP